MENKCFIGQDIPDFVISVCTTDGLWRLIIRSNAAICIGVPSFYCRILVQCVEWDVILAKQILILVESVKQLSLGKPSLSSARS
jgi:hypothetical protein